MNEIRSCEHCGATLAADARFCEECGTSIASPVPATAPPLVRAQPPIAAPRQTNRGLFVGLAIVGGLVVLGCLAVGVFGFLFLQSKPAVLSQLPASTPQVVVVPTYLVPPSVATTVRSPTSAPLATSTPSLSASVLFYDDFASQEVSKRNGWTLSSDDVADRTWLPNQYTIAVKKPGYFMSAAPNGEYDNLGIEVEAQTVSSGYAEYGVLFRSSKTGGAFSYYLFAVTSDGRYYLDKKIADKWSAPKPVAYTTSQFINQGKGKNTLGVIVQGNQISLFINRVQVQTLTDDSITGKGNAGLVVQMGDKDVATVAFSRFTVYPPDKAKAEWCPPNPALPAGVLFNDDFSSARVSACNEWGFGEIGYGLGNVTWSANAFTIALTKAAQRMGFGPRITGEFQDVALETEMQRDNNNAAAYGLMFRFSYDQDKKASHYRFIVNPDGKFALTKLVAGAESTLIDLTASSAIKTGQNKNILGVIMRGSTIALYVNRTLLKTVTDDSIRVKGTVSVFVASETNLPATFTVTRFTILTPEKAQAEWGGASVSSAPPVVASSPQPQIISLEFPKEIPFDTNRYDGQIRFRDDGGDVQRVAFDAPAGSAYQSFGFEFTNPAMRWVEGNATSTSGVFKFSYSCGQPSAVTNLTFTVTLYDKAGNKSAPYPLNFACKSGASNAASVMLINHHSQLCLTIFNGNIVQDECRGTSNQMWQVSSDSGSFQIKSDSGGNLCVGGDGLTMVSCNASPVWNLQPMITSYSQYQSKSHPHPYTSPKPGATGTYFVIGSLGKCVDNDSWSHTVGSRMIYFDCQPLNDNSNQLWARYR